MSGHLRWKKEPAETGLRAVGAGPRSSNLHDGETEYATVAATGGGWHGQVAGWYWAAFERVPYRNTHATPCATEAEAKAKAMAYVKQHLATQP